MNITATGSSVMTSDSVRSAKSIQESADIQRRFWALSDGWRRARPNNDWLEVCDL